MTARPKIVRTEAELECPGLDAALRERGDLVLLPDGVSEDRLRDATSGREDDDNIYLEAGRDR